MSEHEIAPGTASQTTPSRTTATQTAPSSTPEAGTVLLRIADAVATVTLNRPEAMNAMDTSTKVALLGRLREVAEDPAVRCVVLTGTGRAFCVGQDLREHSAMLAAGDPAPLSTVTDHYNPIIELLATMNKPVVAAINGVAAGAGASFALAADLRIIVETGGFNLAFASIALSCDSGASWTLPRLVGIARAMELLMTPRTIPAAEALELGLVNRVVSEPELTDVAGELALRLATGPTLAYGSIRRSVAFSCGHPLSESLAYEADQMALTGDSEDHAAAVAAFLAKEKPAFQGR